MMEQKTFVITGSYKERQEERKFKKEITAVNENYAKEKTVSLIGSKHKIRRSSININGITEKKA